MAINRIKTGGITDGTIQSGDLAPGTVASDRIAPGTIANDRLANNTITINGTSIALGASGDIVAGTDWQAVTVADGSTTVNTVAGGGYLLDTNAGVIEAFLPTSPSRGDTVVIADYSGTFATNRVIVNTGGANIDSSATGDIQLTTNNSIVEFIYIDSSKGWLVKTNQAAGTTPGSALTGYSSSYDITPPFIQATGGTITTDGDYKIHSFTGDGCFVVTQAGLGTACQPSIVDYVVVAGGGGGSHSYGGGGGAGGFREAKAAASPTHTAPSHTASPLAASTGITVTASTYPITVGAGGTQGFGCAGTASNGSNSVFSTITSTGGGAGGNSGSPVEGSGDPGGSGGGGGAYSPRPYSHTPASLNPGGNGNTPPVSPSQGNNGGAGLKAPNGVSSGGGGGAGATGQNAAGPYPDASTYAGDGGAGVGTLINPATGESGPSCLQYYSGGGGGTTEGSTPARGIGGIGGGASGRTNSDIREEADANTGGGGGGGVNNPSPASSGGKGIVIIRYKFQ
jgi:hypothetical protein